MLSGNFDSEVGAAQFALHTLDTGIQVLDRSHKTLHLQNLGRTEFHTNVATLAVLLDNFDRRKFLFHLVSPLDK
jgi:hypothetical protein